jgi:putative membrane protein
VISRTIAFEYAIIYIKGLLMGICDIIPGVSGGTMALITGIYERLVKAIGNIGPSPVRYLVKKDLDSAWSEFEKFDPVFLVVLVAGIGTSFLAMSRIILVLLNDYAVQTFSFFFGLIVASAVVLFLIIEEDSRDIRAALFLAVGAIVGFILAGLNPASLGHSLPVLFFSGMAALCAMILPGISGSYIMLVLGQYEYMLNVIKSLSLIEIVAYAAGGLIGVLLFSRLLKYLLKTHHTAMIAFLTGLMLGSARLLFDKVTVAGGTIGSAWVFVAAGAVVIITMEYVKRIFSDREQKADN